MIFFAEFEKKSSLVEAAVPVDSGGKVRHVSEGVRHVSEGVLSSTEPLPTKSPSLTHKLERSEVIACHQPHPDEASLNEDDAMGPRKSTHMQVSTPRHVLSKTVSVPLLLSESGRMGVVDMGVTDAGVTGAGETNTGVTPAGVPDSDSEVNALDLYVQEGIAWSAGTVKKQLQKQFECLVVSSDSSSKCADVDPGATSCSVVHPRPSGHKSAATETGSPESSSRVRNITAKAGDHSTEHPASTCSTERSPNTCSPSVIIIKKPQSKSAFLGRAKSLGSQYDLPSKRNDAAVADVSTPAASTFRSSANMYKVSKSKQIVIIPKVESVPSQQQNEAAATGTKPSCDDLSMTQDVMSSSSSDSTDDISVKELCVMFESKETLSTDATKVISDVAVKSESPSCSTNSAKPPRSGGSAASHGGVRKSRKLQQGKTHPLSRLQTAESAGSTWGRLYSTM